MKISKNNKQYIIQELSKHYISPQFIGTKLKILHKKNMQEICEKHQNNVILNPIIQHPDIRIRNAINYINMPHINELFQKHNFKKHPINLANLETKNLIQLNKTFYEAIMTKDIDISNWKTTKIIILKSTFYGINELHQNFNKWEVPNLYTFNYTFQNIPKIKIQLDTWCSKKINSMNKTFMNSNQNINMENFISQNRINKNKIEAEETFRNCKYQKNTFKTWNFNLIKEPGLMFYNTPKLIANTKNFYKIKNVYELINMLLIKLHTHNIQSYIEKHIDTEVKIDIVRYLSKLNGSEKRKTLKLYNILLNSIKKNYIDKNP